MTFIIVFSGTGVAPVNKVEMKPCSMMATLIIRSQAKCVSRDENAPRLCTFQNRSEPGGLRNPQTSAQLFRNGSRSPQLCAVLWRGQNTVCEGFVYSTEIVFAAIPPRSTIEITCNQVNFLRNHDCTKSENELLGDAFLFGINVADMKRQHRKVLLPAH